MEMLARMAVDEFAVFKNNFFERVEIAGDDFQWNERVGNVNPFTIECRKL